MRPSDNVVVCYVGAAAAIAAAEGHITECVKSDDTSVYLSASGSHLNKGQLSRILSHFGQNCLRCLDRRSNYCRVNYCTQHCILHYSALYTALLCAVHCIILYCILHCSALYTALLRNVHCTTRHCTVYTALLLYCILHYSEQYTDLLCIVHCTQTF